jgi:sugar lactone lactonase YvrE
MRLTLLRAVVILQIAAAACTPDSTNPGEPPGPEPEPGFGVADGLWIGSGVPPALIRLAPAQLSGTGDRFPATTLTTPSAGLQTLVGVAFDAAGKLWITSTDDNLVLAFEPGALASSGSRTATTVIAASAGSLNAPVGLAFDHAHRLWVANHENGTLVRFDAGQLATGGAVVPAVVLSGLGHPTSLAFDASGALWVSDNVAQSIARYGPEDLAVTGTPVPDVVLTETGDPLPLPFGLAFDANGNLWVANIGARNVVAFAANQLSATGSSAPQTVLSPTGSSIALPVGLAFDAEGSLWVVQATGTVTKFDKPSLAASGSPAPSAQLTITGQSLIWSAAFWPTPAGLPVN